MLIFLKKYGMIIFNTRWKIRSKLVLRHIWGIIIRFEIESPSFATVQNLPYIWRLMLLIRLT